MDQLKEVYFVCGGEVATIKNPETNLYSLVEEQLYILWELTPTNPSKWKKDFFYGLFAEFDYHGLEHFAVFAERTNDICVVQAVKI